jgi:RNA polymerase sigma-70 factor (ECF subfamily)
MAGAAVENWLEAMRPRLVRLAQQFLGQAADAEEIAQEAMTLSWQRGVGRWEPGRRNAWVYRVTVNLSLNRRRRRRPSRPLDETDGQDGLISGSLPGERTELLDRVQLVLRELPDRQSAALILREMEGLEYEAVAEILEVRPAAARLLVHRAREAMRLRLLERWPDTFG